MSSFFNLFKSKSDSDQNNHEIIAKNNPDETLDKAKAILIELLNNSGFVADVDAKIQNNQIRLDILGADDAGRIIGKEGRVIESIQTLVRAIFFKKYPDHKYYLSVDVENYFKNKIEKAKKIAISKSNQLNNENPVISLGMKSAIERKAIHLMFERKQNYKTYSTGKGELKEIFIELVSSGESV